MDHLALQVAVVHHVKVHNANAADTSRRQVKQQGGAQSTRPHAQHTGCPQALLALHADLRQDQMAGKAGDLILAEGYCACIWRQHGGNSR